MLDDAPLCTMLPATDLARARAWYEEKLGLSPEAQDEIGLWYRTGGARFAVYETSFAGTARNTAAEWLVDDLDTVVAALRANGVEFEEYDLPVLRTTDGVAPLGRYRAAWFHDSEGNTLAVGQAPAA